MDYYVQLWVPSISSASASWWLIFILVLSLAVIQLGKEPSGLICIRCAAHYSRGLLVCLLCYHQHKSAAQMGFFLKLVFCILMSVHIM